VEYQRSRAVGSVALDGWEGGVVGGCSARYASAFRGRGGSESRGWVGVGEGCWGILKERRAGQLAFRVSGVDGGAVPSCEASSSSEDTGDESSGWGYL